ncbi:MAG: PEP-CTERM sorting domain-containing protein [Planctomycetes bacterium]|nr:PEP-CTERM sorting domain-containing protein [Planctomycetota bacterium]
MRGMPQLLSAVAVVAVVAAGTSGAYDPVDFDRVIDEAVSANYTIPDGERWLITPSGSVTGNQSVGVSRTGEIVVLGRLDMSSSSYVSRYATGAGTVTVDEDGVLNVASRVPIARDGGTGTVKILGGEANFLGDCVFSFGQGKADTATILQSGGRSTFASNVYMAGWYTPQNGTGRFAISGGEATFSGALRVGANPGTGTARFEVIGAAPTVTVAGSLTLYAGSTLGFTIGAGGVSTIDVTSNAVSLLGGQIDLALDGVTPAEGTTFDLIRSAGIDPQLVCLATGDAAAWALQVNGAGDTLQAVYLVPEPATAALLGLGLLVAARRRRAGAPV